MKTDLFRSCGHYWVFQICWVHSQPNYISQVHLFSRLYLVKLLQMWKFLTSQSYSFSSSHVWIWELDYKESWELKNWCFLNCGVREDSWGSLGLWGDQTSNLNGNQSWIFIGRTDTEAETPILWPPDMMSQLVRKEPDSGKDWRQEEKDEMVGWHHQLKELEFEQGTGDG